LSGIAKLADTISQLDTADREQLAHLLAIGPTVQSAAQAAASMPTPGIVRTPDVCGGAARVIRTRIPVWILERMRQLGISESEILRSYPTLRAVDLVQAWAYVETHADEIEEEIKDNEED